MSKTILEVVRETAEDLHEAGVMDQATLEQFSVRNDIEAGLADAEAGRVNTAEVIRSRLFPNSD